METAKVFIFRNDEKMWEVGIEAPLSDGSTMWYSKHEASTWADAAKWVERNYVG